MNEISRIIIKAKKLARLATSANTHEATLAKEQLDKLKKKWKLLDEMILPIYSKCILEIKKEEVLDMFEEFLVYNTGELFGNKVYANNSHTRYEIFFKGNDITIDNALKTISYIKEIVHSFIVENPVIDSYSFKCGLIITLFDYLNNHIEKIVLVEDNKAEKEDLIKTTHNELLEKEGIIPVEKRQPNIDIMNIGKNMNNKEFISVIEEYIKTIRRTSEI